MPNTKVVESSVLSRPGDTRYVVIDEDTGKILDDADGYGYKTKQNAHRAYGYRSASPAVKKRREQTKKAVREWCIANKTVVKDLSDEAFYAAKDGESFDAENVKRYLRQNGIEMPFTVQEFLRYW